MSLCSYTDCVCSWKVFDVNMSVFLPEGAEQSHISIAEVSGRKYRVFAQKSEGGQSFGGTRKRIQQTEPHFCRWPCHR